MEKDVQLLVILVTKKKTICNQEIFDIFYLACYGIVSIPDGDWYCGRCEAGDIRAVLKIKNYFFIFEKIFFYFVFSHVVYVRQLKVQ
jgi:hypothetical protein